MSNPLAPLELGKLKVYPLAERRSESRLEEILVEPADGPAPCPAHIARIIRDCALRTVATSSAPVNTNTQ